MIINDVVSVTLNGNSSFPDSLNIVNSVNKAYSSCVITGLSLQGAVGDTLSVIINNDTYSFIITEINFEEFSKISIRGFGLPYKLETKQVNTSNTIYADSNSLIDMNKDDVTVVNNIPNIVFDNVSYSKDGTALSAMQDMLSVIGGELYEVKGALVLDIFKRIFENETPFASIQDGNVFKYSYTNKAPNPNKVKNILINPITNDIYSIPQVNIDFDEKLNRGIFLFNPSLNDNSTYKIQGVSVSNKEAIYYTEIFSLNDDTVITTLGGIDSVISLTIDNVEVLEDNYEHYVTHNKIRFTDKRSGNCIIKYQTNILKFSIFKDTSISAKYLNAILNTNLSFYSENKDPENKIEIPDDIILENGGGSVRIVPPFMYGEKGVVLSSGGISYDLVFYDKNNAGDFDNYEFIKSYTLPLNNETLNIYCKYKTGLFWDSSFLYNAEIKDIADVVVEEFKVSESPKTDSHGNSPTYYYQPLNSNISVNDILADGNSLYESDYEMVGGEFRLLNHNYIGSVFKISYTVFKNKITFPLPTPDVNVTTIEAKYQNTTTSLDFINPKNNLCVVPSMVTVNVAEQLNVSVAKAYGNVISGDFGDLTVDYFGNVEVYVTNKKIYVLDTNSIVPYSSITIDARGVL